MDMKIHAVSLEHALLDNLEGLPPEEFCLVRHAGALTVVPLATAFWSQVARASDAVAATGEAGLALVGPPALLTSLYTETLLHAVVRHTERVVGREYAIRFIRDSWIGKGVETLRELFPDVQIRVEVRDGRPGVPEVPPAPDGQ